MQIYLFDINKVSSRHTRNTLTNPKPTIATTFIGASRFFLMSLSIFTQTKQHYLWENLIFVRLDGNIGNCQNLAKPNYLKIDERKYQQLITVFKKEVNILFKSKIEVLFYLSVDKNTEHLCKSDQMKLILSYRFKILLPVTKLPPDYPQTDIRVWG